MSAPTYTQLAFILALSDFPGSLNATERETIQRIAKDIKLQPKAWQDIEILLLQMIEKNQNLKESYEFYKANLEQVFDSFQEIPSDYLPQAEELKPFAVNNHNLLKEKGFDPESEAVGYQEQINNAVIVVGQSDRPEETAKKLAFAHKLKQLLRNRTN